MYTRVVSLFRNKSRNYLLLVVGICLAFFAAYLVLTFVRYFHYQSFGYDLGINDQTVWRYSRFELPVSTIAPYPDKSKLYLHVELIYALVAPFYWIWSARRMLLIVEIAIVCSGGIALYFLARHKKISYPVSVASVISYLAFFGVQNAIWFDVHSITFAAGFLCWLLLFLEKKRFGWATVFFLLALTSKENVGVITFCIGVIYYLQQRNTISAFIAIASAMYVGFIYFIYFPHIIQMTYLYQNSGGLLSNLNPISLVDTVEKIKTI